MKNNIDISGFEKKMRLAQKQVDEDLPKLIEDTAIFILAKLQEEVLNGASGPNYPKAYPSTISEGATGFVGVISSMLRRSMGIDKLNRYEITIRQTTPSEAPYHDKIIRWSKQKYGKNFYEITIQIWGSHAQTKIIETLDRLIDGVDKGKNIPYRNPF